MSTLTRFSQSDREHDLYMRRLEYLSVENSWKSGIAEAEKKAQLAEKERDQAQKERDAAQQANDIVQKERDQVQKERDAAQQANDIFAAQAEREILELRKALAEAKKAQKP